MKVIIFLTQKPRSYWKIHFQVVSRNATENVEESRINSILELNFKGSIRIKALNFVLNKTQDFVNKYLFNSKQWRHFKAVRITITSYSRGHFEILTEICGLIT